MNKIIIASLMAISVLLLSSNYSYAEVSDSYFEKYKTWIEDYKVWAEETIEQWKQHADSLASKIETLESKIQTLEKENRELRQKIESLESENTSQQDTTDMIQRQEKELAYATTDKQEYTLGDTIQVRGLAVLEGPEKIDGSFETIDAITFSVAYLDGTTADLYDSNRQLQCLRNQEDTFGRIPEFKFEPGVFYDFDSIKEGMPEKCDIDKDGRMNVSFEVHGGYYLGEYQIQMGGGIRSETFMVK